MKCKDKLLEKNPYKTKAEWFENSEDATLHNLYSRVFANYHKDKNGDLDDWSTLEILETMKSFDFDKSEPDDKNSIILEWLMLLAWKDNTSPFVILSSNGIRKAIESQIDSILQYAQTDLSFIAVLKNYTLSEEVGSAKHNCFDLVMNYLCEVVIEFDIMKSGIIPHQNSRDYCEKIEPAKARYEELTKKINDAIKLIFSNQYEFNAEEFVERIRKIPSDIIKDNIEYIADSIGARQTPEYVNRSKQMLKIIRQKYQDALSRKAWGEANGLEEKYNRFVEEIFVGKGKVDRFIPKNLLGKFKKADCKVLAEEYFKATKKRLSDSKLDGFTDDLLSTSSLSTAHQIGQALNYEDSRIGFFGLLMKMLRWMAVSSEILRPETAKRRQEVREIWEEIIGHNHTMWREIVDNMNDKVENLNSEEGTKQVGDLPYEEVDPEKKEQSELTRNSKSNNKDVDGNENKRLNSSIIYDTSNVDEYFGTSTVTSTPQHRTK